MTILRVLGLDPGTRHFGWGVVERAGTRLTRIAHGVISPDTELALANRLVVIEAKLERVVRDHAPTCAAAEAIFFAKDAQAASKLGHARGVGLLVCARAGLLVFEYPPARVKLSVAGGGRADKTQVSRMVRAILRIHEMDAAALPVDASDALAVAITHLQRSPALAASVLPGIAAKRGGLHVHRRRP